MNIRQMVGVGCIGVLAIFGSTEAVQAQGRGMRMGSSVSRLLLMPEVQAELKLESDLLDKVKTFADEIQTKMRDEIQMVRDQGLEEADTRAEMAAVAEQFLAKDMTELAKILSVPQMVRFKQLMVQQQGASSAIRKDVADAIGLNDDDRAKLKATIDGLNEANMAKLQDLFQSGDRDQIQKVMADNRKLVEETVLAALDNEQKEKLAELKGAEFKFPEPQAPGGRRRDF